MKLKKQFTTLLLILFTSYVTAQNTITLNHLENYVWLNSPKFSPDAKSILFTKRIANLDDNKYENQLFVLDKKTNKKTRLNFAKGIRSANWSSNGLDVFFISRVANKASQVFKMPVNGGEAIQITNHGTGIMIYAVSPDGKKIAFIAKEAKEEKKGRNRHLKSFKVGYDWYLAKEKARSNHLWIYDLDTKKEHRLTSGEESYSTVSANISWSLDNKRILYTMQPKPHSSEYLNSVLKVIDVTTKKVEIVDNSMRVPKNPKFTNSGDILYSKSQGKEFYFTPNGIYTATQPDKPLFEIDRNVRHSYLLSNDKVLVGAPDGTTVSLWLGSMNGKHKKLNLKNIIPSVSNVATSSNGEIVFVGTTSTSPPELYYMKNTNSTPKKLTNFNEKIAQLDLGKTQSINWKSTDNKKYYEDGILIFPPNYQKSKKYPLVLNIHGGPMGYSTEEFNFSGQNFAAQGWIVFQPNYRGSSNLGYEYQSSVINDAGEGPGKDVMAGIEKIKKMGIIDENNIAVSGWSYGGYMTVWLTSHYDGWKSAVAGAAVTDWFDWYTMADWNVWSGRGLGGSPWLNNNAENYRKQSPITYAHKIKTPTLILSNTLDPRVTVSQSFKLFSNLKDNGVKTEFIAYPLPGHFPQDPIHRLDVYKRWMDWIKVHFN